MASERRPTLEEFLAAPDADIAAVAPLTAVFAPGGTRRRAAMEGIPLDETYIAWARLGLVASLALFFRLGIRHLLVPTLGPRQPAEAGRYGEHIVAWIVDALAGPAMLADYGRHGWGARMIVPSAIAELREAAARLKRSAPGTGGHTVWYYLVAEHADPWLDLLAAAHESGVRTRAELILTLYGEPVPPATLAVSFGKPTTGTTLIPPLLIGPEMHCYATQRAGFEITEPMLRRIIYDYAYARPTWLPDRNFRYAHAREQQARWETTAILGVGSQVDGFWYPDAFPGLAAGDESTPPGAGS